MLNRILNSAFQRARSRIVEYNVRRFCSPKGRLVCGPAALVHNHGVRQNIVLGDGVILNGTLECYHRGKLLVDEFSYIGFSRVLSAQSITIGKGVFIADYVSIYDSNLHPLSARRRYEDIKAWHEGTFPDVYTGIPSNPVTIANYAWIGTQCVIGEGVTVGEGAIVAAGSVVTKDVPAYSVAQGNPARIVCPRLPAACRFS
jgi:acetyltransferase-like isoleucine patch superfamily enzyme